MWNATELVKYAVTFVILLSSNLHDHLYPTVNALWSDQIVKLSLENKKESWYD